MFDALLREVQRFFGDADSAVAARHALLEAELSHDQTRKALSDALRAEKAAAGMDKVYAWPRDVYDDRVVYELETPTGTHLYQRGYSTDEAGKVTLATDVLEVKAQTVYQPIASAPPAQGPEPVAESGNLAPLTAEAWDQLLERTFSAEQRKALAASGQALADGSFPIVTEADLRNAISAFGRAADKAAAKRHIIKRAKALGKTALLPNDWNVAEAAAGESLIVGDVIPLVEKSVRRDGTVPMKIIQPGWGTSGYYDAAVLERDGPKVFTKGLKMYWDHPTPTEESERPERSLRDLAAELTGPARYVKEGPAGPGLYADAKVFGPYKESVEELAPHMGVSIRALGHAKHGEAEGKSGPIVESLVAAQSVDFVTTPGAGGQVLQLFEAARGGRIPAPPTTQEDTPVTEELSESVRQRLEAQDTEIARLREVQLFREAREIASDAMSGYDLPDVTRARLIETLAKNPALAEDKTLDVEAFKTKVTEAVKVEVEYLARAAGIGDGQVRGAGGADAGATPVTEAEAEAQLTDAFKALGLSESTAKLAAAGREH